LPKRRLRHADGHLTNRLPRSRGACYVCDAMTETTTIRLPPKLRARLRAIAKDTDRSVHSIIVEAVEKHAAHEEQMRSLVREALAADAASAQASLKDASSTLADQITETVLGRKAA